jgi:hypothetical protein
MKQDPELVAMSRITRELESLPTHGARRRVLEWVGAKLEQITEAMPGESVRQLPLIREAANKTLESAARTLNGGMGAGAAGTAGVAG